MKDRSYTSIGLSYIFCFLLSLITPYAMGAGDNDSRASDAYSTIDIDDGEQKNYDLAIEDYSTIFKDQDPKDWGMKKNFNSKESLTSHSVVIDPNLTPEQLGSFSGGLNSRNNLSSLIQNSNSPVDCLTYKKEKHGKVYWITITTIACGMGLNLISINSGSITPRICGFLASIPVSVVGLCKARKNLVSAGSKAYKKTCCYEQEETDLSLPPPEHAVTFVSTSSVNDADEIVQEATQHFKEMGKGVKTNSPSMDLLNEATNSKDWDHHRVDQNTQEIRTIHQAQAGESSVSNVCTMHILRMLMASMVITAAFVDGSFDALLAGETLANLIGPSYSLPQIVGFCFGVLWNYIPTGSIALLGAVPVANAILKKNKNPGDQIKPDLNLVKLLEEYKDIQLADAVDNPEEISKKIAKINAACHKRNFPTYIVARLYHKAEQRVSVEKARIQQETTASTLGVITLRERLMNAYKQHGNKTKYITYPARSIMALAMSYSLVFLFASDVIAKAYIDNPETDLSMGASDANLSMNATEANLFMATTEDLDASFVSTFLNNSQLLGWALAAYGIQGLNVFSLSYYTLQDIANFFRTHSNAKVRERTRSYDPTYYKRAAVKAVAGMVIGFGYSYNLLQSTASITMLSKACIATGSTACSAIAPPLVIGVYAVVIGGSFVMAANGAELLEGPTKRFFNLPWFRAKAPKPVNTAHDEEDNLLPSPSSEEQETTKL